MNRTRRIASLARSGFRLITNKSICPMCGADALCLMPAELIARQPDGTNIVCHPLLGGCEHGFEAEVAYADSKEDSNANR